MGFPVYIDLGPVGLQAHWVLESLAYFIGFRLYLRARARRGDAIPGGDRMWVVAAAMAGAAIGSKLLYWLGDPFETLRRWPDPYYLMGGKTIVGGLIGGLIAVEWAKRRLGIRRRTGDLFAVPLAVGIAIGRAGCFLGGLSDDTYGAPTALGWGVDFGDGLRRHPVQLYEIAFLLPLAWLLKRRFDQPHREGDIFKLFMIAYLSFRLLVEFLKPGMALGGLTAIQWACFGALIHYSRDLPSLFHRKEARLS
jgi:prolipoprotein diacylglyceryltransferase